MKELDPSIYKNKVENPKETVYEVITVADNLGWGLAIADIEESELHFHNQTKELYIVLEGSVEVTMDSETKVLKEGDSLEILPGLKHKAKSLGSDRARIVAITIPAWTLEDHHLHPANPV